MLWEKGKRFCRITYILLIISTCITLVCANTLANANKLTIISNKKDQNNILSKDPGPNIVITSVVPDTFDGQPILKMTIKNEGTKNVPPDSPVEIIVDVKFFIFSLITIYTNKRVFLPDTGIAIGESVSFELDKPPVLGIHRCIFEIGPDGILNENPNMNNKYSEIFLFLL